jgi:pimeloyl-ACP methyl ester carboxylesterase
MIKNVILIFTLTLPILTFGQISYGDNPDSGKYVQSEDARIYYEVYGKGKPLLLIHGSLFGYISEFKHILPTLTNDYKVIAVALRGHGKSEIGDIDYSYSLFAQDMIKVLDAEGLDSVNIVGFSSGAITAIRIAADYPDRVVKVVSIAGALGAKDKNPEKLEKQIEETGEDFVSKYKGFVVSRKQLMPEPDRFIDFYNKLKVAHTDSIWISKESALQIKSPLLIIGGDRDAYFPIQAFTRMYSLIPNSRLMIFPKSGHVDVLKNMTMYNDFVIPFLNEN